MLQTLLGGANGNEKEKAKDKKAENMEEKGAKQLSGK